MKKDLSILVQSIALGAVTGVQQPVTANVFHLYEETSEKEAATRLRAIKASLSKPSFILKTIDVNSGAYDGNYHTSHRSHSSHRSHYSSASGSSSGSYSSGGGSSSSYSSSGSTPTRTYSSSTNSHPTTTGSSIEAATAIYKLGDRLLYLGRQGSDVAELKKRLVQQGYYLKTNELPLTDIFDEDTRSAVKKFQHAHNLTEDYIVDKALTAYLTDNSDPIKQKNALGSRELQWGIVGPDVIELKNKLIQKGFFKMKANQTINDRFDDATEQAVKDLQLANGLSVTGTVTAQVFRLLS